MPDIIHHTGWVIERCPFCRYETEAHEALDLLPDGKWQSWIEPQICLTQAGICAKCQRQKRSPEERSTALCCAWEKQAPSFLSSLSFTLQGWQPRRGDHNGLQWGMGLISGGSQDPLSSWGVERPDLGESFMPQSLLSRYQEGT